MLTHVHQLETFGQRVGDEDLGRVRHDYLAAVRGTIDAARKLQEAGQLTSA